LAQLTRRSPAGVVLGCAATAGAAYGWLAVGLLLTGFGVSFVLPALVTFTVNAAPPGTAGAAGGLLNAVRQTGATVGVAVMDALAGSGVALFVSAAVCLVCSVAYL
jgi:DHA2 family methylenomycin A resistance protein-like MFS transporter